MKFTPFAGLTELEENDPITLDGGSFLTKNPKITDQLLRVGAVTHRHDAHPALVNPHVGLTGQVVASGGTLAGSSQFAVTYTVVDKQGGETIAGPPLVLVTGSQVGAPTVAPQATLVTSAGILPAGSYFYALTYTDGDGGETTLGPQTLIQVPPGNASASIVLSGLAAELHANGPVNWRLWRSYEGQDWHLASQGGSNTYDDAGFNPPDDPARPPLGNTTASTYSLLVTLPTAAQEPAIASGTAINLYLAPDTNFNDPSFYLQLPIGSAGHTIQITQEAVSAGSPPKVSTSIPGAGQIYPDTDLIFGVKSPVTSVNLLPSGAVGDLRMNLADRHLYGVLSPSGAAAPSDWVDLTALWESQAHAGITVAGPGTPGSFWSTTTEFVPSGAILTGTAWGNRGHPLVIPKSIEVGDLMLLSQVLPGGTENDQALWPGWTLVASANSTLAGMSFAVFSRVATAEDGGTVLQNSNNIWTGNLRAYKSSGVLATQITYGAGGSPDQLTPPVISPPGVAQVDFFGAFELGSVDNFDYFLQFQTNPGSNTLSTFQTGTTGMAQAASEDWLATPVTGGQLVVVGADQPSLCCIGLTLAAPADMPTGSMADFAVASGEANMTVTNGLLTTSNPNQVKITGTGPGGSAPFVASGDKYAVQWTRPGMVGSGYKVRAHYQLPLNQSDLGTQAIVVNMVDPAPGGGASGVTSGLAFFFGLDGAGWTTHMDWLGSVQSTVGNPNTKQNNAALAASRSVDFPFEGGVVPDEFWVEVGRVGNKIVASMFINDPHDPFVEATPDYQTSFDVTGDPNYGPSIAGYFGFTFDVLSDQLDGIAEIELLQLQPETRVDFVQGVEFNASGGAQVQVINLEGTPHGEDISLGGVAAQVVITAGAPLMLGGSGRTGLMGPEGYIEFAGSGGVGVALQPIAGGSARILIGMPPGGGGGGGGGGGLGEISGSADAGAISPVNDIEFAGSGGTGVAVQNLGGGSARVLVSAPAGGGGSLTGIAVAGSGGVGEILPEIYVEFTGSGGTGVAVQNLGGGSARVVISGGGGGGGGTASATGSPFTYLSNPAAINLGAGVGNPQTVAVGTAVPVGTLAVLAFGAKSAVWASNLAVTDAKGNTWTIGADYIDGVGAAGTPAVVLAWSVITNALIATDNISIANATSAQGDLAGALALFSKTGTIRAPIGERDSSFNSLSQRLSVPLNAPAGALLIGAGLGQRSGSTQADTDIDTARAAGWNLILRVQNGQSALPVYYKIASGLPEQFAIKSTDFQASIVGLAFA